MRRSFEAQVLSVPRPDHSILHRVRGGVSRGDWQLEWSRNEQRGTPNPASLLPRRTFQVRSSPVTTPGLRNDPQWKQMQWLGFMFIKPRVLRHGQTDAQGRTREVPLDAKPAPDTVSESWAFAYFMTAPGWFPVALFALLPATRGVRWMYARRRYPKDQCSRCGYDLRATPDRCPECGTEVTKRIRERRWNWRPKPSR